MVVIEVLLALGAAGAFLGWFVGHGSRSEAAAYGALVGLVAGVGIDAVLLNRVMDSHSSTAGACLCCPSR